MAASYLTNNQITHKGLETRKATETLSLRVRRTNSRSRITCDTRSARLISHIRHTCEFRQYCYVGNTAQQDRLGWFQDPDVAGALEHS